MLEVDVLVVVVVVVAVDPVVDVCHCVEDGERHAGEHQGDKLAEEELVPIEIHTSDEKWVAPV